MKYLIVLFVAVAFLATAGLAFAAETSGANWDNYSGIPMIDQLREDAFGHTSSYTQADAYEPAWFGINAGLDLILYEDRLWELKQTNDYSTRGNGEYYVGGRVAFNVWEYFTGQE